MEKSIVGVPWFQRRDYGRVLEVMADAHALPPSFDAWLVFTEKVCRDLAGSGFKALPVAIQPEKFVHWCRHRDIRPDAKARREYASVIADGQSVGACE